MIALDVVDGDVHGVIAAGPAQLVGVAGEHRLALERLGHVDDLSLAIGKEQSGKERRVDGRRLHLSGRRDGRLLRGPCRLDLG